MSLTYTLPLPCKRCRQTTLHIWRRRFIPTFYRCQKCGKTRNYRLNFS